MIQSGFIVTLLQFFEASLLHFEMLLKLSRVEFSDVVGPVRSTSVLLLGVFSELSFGWVRYQL